MRCTRLPEDARKALAVYAAKVGSVLAAKALGVGVATLMELRAGGLAKPETIKRLELRIKEVCP